MSIKKTVNFLPPYFRTIPNKRFLNSTLDRLMSSAQLESFDGYIGRKFNNGTLLPGGYIQESTPLRDSYQLEPNFIVSDNNDTVQSVISFEDILNTIAGKNGSTSNWNRLLSGNFYSWRGFTDLDKLINYQNYVWLSKTDPDNNWYWNNSVLVTNDQINPNNNYAIIKNLNSFEVSGEGSVNPDIELLRGGTYTFTIQQSDNFSDINGNVWIQNTPGVSDPNNNDPALDIRNVLGVTNNGINNGQITFSVPTISANQFYINLYTFGDSRDFIDLAIDSTFVSLSGSKITTLQSQGGIDGIIDFVGKTILFPNDETALGSWTIENNNGVINLVQNATILTNYKVTILNGLTHRLTSYYMMSNGAMQQVPPTSSLSQKLYIQDDSNPNRIITLNIQNDSSLLAAPLLESALVASSSNIVLSGLQAIDGIELAIGDRVLIFGQTVTSQNGVYIANTSSWQRSNDTNGYALLNNFNIQVSSGFTYANEYFSYVTPTNFVFQQSPIIFTMLTNTPAVNVTDDILGKISYTSGNGIELTNGLKISFNSYAMPAPFNDPSRSWIVEGVGTGIMLVPLENIIIPASILLQNNPADYITINRASVDGNQWSSSNQWINKDAILKMVNYLTNQGISVAIPSSTAKAQRPIIEFFSGLTLFGYGTTNLPSTTYFDNYALDAFNNIEGSTYYVVDGNQVNDGDTIIFNADKNLLVRSNIYKINFVNTTSLTKILRLAPVIVATTNNIILSNIQIIDGITLSVGDRILVTAQTDSTENGIYIVANGTWSRSVDLNNNDQFHQSFGVLVLKGIINSGSYVNYVNQNFISIGTSNIVFTFGGISPIITLDNISTASIDKTSVLILNGSQYQGTMFIWNITTKTWNIGQNKSSIQQAPIFDVVDHNGVSYSNTSIYINSTFIGSKLFTYATGSGVDDSIIGTPLLYGQIGNNNDIVFNNNFYTDTFSYQTSGLATPTNLLSGSVTKFDIPTNELISYSAWQFINANYELYQNITYTGVQEITLNAKILQKSTINAFPLRIYVDGTLLKNSDYIVTQVLNNQASFVTITIITEVDVNSIILVKIIAEDAIPGAWYDVPPSFQNNPLGQNLVQFAVSELREHTISSQNNLQLVGSTTSLNLNLNDFNNVPGSLLWQDSQAGLASLLIADQNFDIDQSIKSAAEDYILYKQKFFNIASQIPNISNMAVKLAVDTVISQLSSMTLSGSSWQLSDMIGTGGIKTSYKIQNNGVTNFPLKQKYNWNSANSIALYVYLNETQLFNNIDYSTTTGSILNIIHSMIPGDILDVYEISSTVGTFVPTTPAKLGLGALYQPQIYTDNTYVTPVQVILGHDGSITTCQGDYRDNLLLEFECRIFNNIKINNQLWQDIINNRVPNCGLWRDLRSTDNIEYSPYNINEQNAILQRMFYEWVSKYNISYQTSYYNSTDYFTWNWSGSVSKIDDISLQGYWKGIYKYAFDTIHPDTRPWELLGITVKPQWWDTTYGPSPYTGKNSIMWNDLMNGIIRNPSGIENSVYGSRLFDSYNLNQIIPVDASGNLLDPNSSIVKSVNNYTLQNQFIFGDGAPAETAWMQSSYYPYAKLRMQILKNPLFMCGNLWDLDNYVPNDNGSFTFNNQLGSFSQVTLNSSTTPKHSIINFTLEYLTKQGLQSTQLQTALDNTTINLVYPLGGFSDVNNIIVYADQGNFQNTVASVVIPTEDYSLFLDEGVPTGVLSYSGIIISKVSNGYQINGYDLANPFFQVLASESGPSSIINVGQTSYQIANNYASSPTDIPYNYIFYSIQNVFDFIISYGRYLTSIGLKFNISSSEQKISWQDAGVQFIKWAYENWSISNNQSISLVLNPSSSTLEYIPVSGTLQDLTSSQSSVLDLNQNQLDSHDLDVFRDTDSIKISHLGNSVISALRANIISFEHKLIIKNTSIFNDVIYDPAQGLRQLRLRIVGQKTADWNGTLNTPGFMIVTATVPIWQTMQDYLLGSLVSFKNTNYVATSDIIGSNNFQYNQFKSISTVFTNSVLPNLSVKADDLTNAYNVQYTNYISDFIRLRANTIGYVERDWLSNLGIDLNSQTNFYKGWIKEKGSINAVNAFERSSNSSNNLNVIEEYAFKLGDYGATNRTGYTEVQLSAANNINPLVISFTDTPDSTVTDIMQVTTSALYKKGNNWNTNFIPNQGQLKVVGNNLIAAGPVLPDIIFNAAITRVPFISTTDETNLYFQNNNDLLTRSNQTSILKIARNNGLFWIANDQTVTKNNQWNVIKFIPAITDIVTVTQVDESTLSINLSSDINVTIGDEIILDLDDEISGLIIQGIFQILNYYVDPSTTYVSTLIIQTQPSQFSISGSIDYSNSSIKHNVFCKQSLRNTDIGTSNIAENNILSSSPEPLLFVDNDSTGWASYQYTEPYVDLITPVPGSSSALSYSIAYDSPKNLLWVGKPTSNANTGTIILKSVSTFVNTNGQTQPTLNVDFDDVLIARSDSQMLGSTIQSLTNGFLAASASSTTGNGQLYIIQWNADLLNNSTIILQALQAPGIISSDFGYSLATDSTGTRLFVGSPSVNRVDVFKQYNSIAIDYGSLSPINSEITLSSSPDSVYSIRVIATDHSNNLSAQLLIAENEYTLNGNILTFSIPISNNAQVTITQLDTYYVPVSFITGNNNSMFGYTVACNQESSLLAIGSPLDNNVGTTLIQQRVVETVILASPTTNITIKNAVLNSSIIQITVNNVLLSSSSAITFTITGQLITFSSALLVNSVVIIDHNRYANGQLLIGLENDKQFGSAIIINQDVLIIGSPETTTQNNSETIYNAGAVYMATRNIPTLTGNDQYLTIGNDGYIENFIPYQIVDNITNSTGINLGTDIRWITDNLIGIVGSQIDSYPDASQTIFNDGTFFDASHTKFFDGQTGILGNFTVYQLLTTQGAWTNTANNVSQITPIKNIQFSALTGVNLVFDGAINNIWILNRDSVTESLTLYNNQSNYSGWTILNQETPKIDTSAISAAWLYDITTNTKLIDLEIADLSSGLLPTTISQYIDYIADFDPACYSYQNWLPAQSYAVGERVLYNNIVYQSLISQISGVYFNNNNWEEVNGQFLSFGKDQWGTNNAGSTWVLTNQLRVIDAQLGTTDERAESWNSWFPNTTIQVFEWIVSSVPPTQYTSSDENGYISSINIPYIFDSNTNQYAFWVYNKTTAGEKYPISSSDIASQIQNINTAGIPIISALDTNTISLWNVGTYAALDNTVLHIDYVISDSDNNLHSEFLLVSNTGKKTWVGTPLYQKFIDSLSGQTSTSALVPDISLPISQRYGILLNPQQSIFVNRPDALLVYYQSINSQLLSIPMATNNAVSGLFGVSPIPNLGYSLTVPTRDVLNSLNPDQYPQNYKILVSSDSMIKNNGWSIVTKEANNTWSLLANQTYDLSTLWNYVDWSSSNAPSGPPTYTLNTIGDLPSITLQQGNTIGILNNGNGKFAIYQANYNGLQLELDPVYIEDGTIQFSNELFNFSSVGIGFDLTGFDQVRYFDDDPAIPISLITGVLNKQILIGDLSYIADEAFFVVLKYIIHENVNLDWLFGTSFVTVQYPISTLGQNINFQINDQDIIEDFITETLPFHTRVREFSNVYDALDNSANISVIDFDLPAQYDTLYAASIYGTGITNIPLIRTPDGSESTDTQTLMNSTYSSWNNNHSYSVGSIDVIDSGSNYTSTPQIVISGGGGSGATAIAIIDPVAQNIISVRITNPGSGYITEPNVKVLNTGINTIPAILYPRLNNTLTRKINSVLRFDRVGYDVDYYDTNAIYTANSIVFDKNTSTFYEALVNSPNGNLIDTTNWEIAPTNDIAQTTAFNRISALYAPQSNMLGKQFPQLMSGLNNTRLTVSDLKFVNSYIIPSSPFTNQDDPLLSDVVLNIDFNSLYISNTGFNTTVVKFGNQCGSFSSQLGRYFEIDLTNTTEQNQLNIANNDFTLEFFVRFSSLENQILNSDGSVSNIPAEMVIVDTRTYSGNFSNSGILITKTINNQIQLSIGDSIIATGGGITSNIWQYITVQRKTTATSTSSSYIISLHVDGEIIASINTIAETPYISDEGLTFGSDASGNFISNGYLDEYRLTVNVARYSVTEDISVPIVEFPRSIFGDPYFDENYTKVLYGFEGLRNEAPANIAFNVINGQEVINDNSWNKKVLEITNPESVIVQNSSIDSLHNLKSALFNNPIIDGTGSIISSSVDYNFGVEDFAIEFWINQSISSGLQTLLNIIPAALDIDTNNYSSSSFSIYIENNELIVLNASGNISTVQINSTTKINTNTTYFISVERHNQQMSLYINGLLQNTVYFPDNVPTVFLGNTSTGIISISGNAAQITFATDSNYITPFIGQLSNIRITNGSSRHVVLTNIDNFSSQFSDTTLGMNFLDLDFDGGNFVDSIVAQSPEEHVYARCYDSLDIQVTTANTQNGNSFVSGYHLFKSTIAAGSIISDSFTTDGISSSYRVPWEFLNSDSVAVVLGNVILAGNSFTISNNSINFTNIPANNTSVMISATGPVEYYNMNSNSSLTSSLIYGDTSINIANVDGFVTPQPLIRNYGYIFVNGEKISYTYIDRVNNIVSGIQRGIDGTSSANVIPAGTTVISNVKITGNPGYIPFGYTGNV